MRARFLLLLSAVLACGCASYQDYNYNRTQRQRANIAFSESYGGINSGVSKDFRDGWKQGYVDLSRGLCDELPAVPPHKYWAASYQSPEGRCCIDEWYAGWRAGADAAKACGNPEWHRITPSPAAPSPAENAVLNQTVQASPPGQAAANLAQRPKLNAVPQATPSFKQAPPLPEEVEVAPPAEPMEDPELKTPLSIRPVNGETNYIVDDNYAVPSSPSDDTPIGEGVENQ